MHQLIYWFRYPKCKYRIHIWPKFVCLDIDSQDIGIKILDFDFATTTNIKNNMVFDSRKYDLSYVVEDMKNNPRAFLNFGLIYDVYNVCSRIKYTVRFKKKWDKKNISLNRFYFRSSSQN
jgi:hypothetical protein